MDLYVHDDTLLRWEQALALQPDDAAGVRALQLRLAWHLRQREPERALQLTQALLADEADAVERARLLLVLAEQALHRGDLGMLAARLAEIPHVAAPDIQVDVWLLRAGQLQQQGRQAELLDCLARGRAIALEAGDAQREQTLALYRALRITYADPLQGRRQGAPDEAAIAQAPVGVSVWAHELQGTLHAQASQYGRAAAARMRAYADALSTGQIQRAAIAAHNAADALNNLDEREQALKWMEQALALARSRGWRPTVGVSLAQMGETLRRMGRFGAAEEALAAAGEALCGERAARPYAMLLNYQADLQLDRGDWAAAEAYLQELLAFNEREPQPDLLVNAWRGLARVRSGLGQAQPALEAGQRALELAQQAGHVLRELSALRVLADIHAAHALPPPPDFDPTLDANACFHYLRKALAFACGIEGYLVPAELYEALAEAHARLGQFEQAYALSSQAAQARQRIRNDTADKRLVALQVLHDTETARSEAAHLRQLAAEQAQRAEALEQARVRLEALSRWGRDITASLEFGPMLEALLRGLAQLLGVDHLFLQRAGAAHSVDLALGEAGPEGGRQAEAVLQGLLVAVLAQGQELEGRSAAGLHLLAVPLLVGERVLAALGLPARERPYDAQERLLLRTLCAYGGVALANVDAMQQLQQAQAQIIQQEKLASLGQLVASVAHEINTPIGAIKASGANAVDAVQRVRASALAFAELDAPTRASFARLTARSGQAAQRLSSREERALVTRFAERLAGQGLADARRLAALLVQLDPATEVDAVLPILRHRQADMLLERMQALTTLGASLGTINLAAERVAKIVFALKSYARQVEPGPMQPHSLQEGLETVLTLYQHQLRHGTELRRDYQTVPPVLCQPDELNQVWTNLIHNALQAMEYRGRLSVQIERRGTAVAVTVGDTGCGIPEALRERIFEPFFTTKPVGEGSGLGLDIVRQIVARHQGRIELWSEVGQGSRFTVLLPLQT